MMYNQILKKLNKKQLLLPITSTLVTTNNYYDIVVNKTPYTIQVVSGYESIYNKLYDSTTSILKIILINNITNRDVTIDNGSTRGHNRIEALKKHLMSC